MASGSPHTPARETREMKAIHKRAKRKAAVLHMLSDGMKHERLDTEQAKRLKSEGSCQSGIQHAIDPVRDLALPQVKIELPGGAEMGSLLSVPDSIHRSDLMPYFVESVSIENLLNEPLYSATESVCPTPTKASFWSPLGGEEIKAKKWLD